MEKVIVKFKNEEQEINIEFRYDSIDDNLDYDIICNPPLTKEDNSKLITVLAYKLLDSLKENG